MRFNRAAEAGGLVVTAGVAAWFSATVVVRELGYVSLTFGVDAPLFMTALSGVAVGVASATRTPETLPWGRRQLLIQQGWVAAIACLGWVSVWLAGGTTNPGPLARNVVIFGGVSVVAAQRAGERFVWVPAVTWVIASTFIGRINESPGGPAFILDEATSWWHWCAAIMCWLAGAIAINHRRMPQMRRRPAWMGNGRLRP